jgi:glutamate-1-semialdehyde 2,1-aminomutase
VLAKASFPIQLIRIGSLFWLALHDGPPPRTAIALSEQATARYSALFHALLDRGIYFPPSAYEVCFLSLAHKPSDLDRLAQGLREALATVE